MRRHARLFLFFFHKFFLMFVLPRVKKKKLCREMVSSFVCFNCVFLLLLTTLSCCSFRVLIGKIDAVLFQHLTSCLLHLLCPTLGKNRLGVDSPQGKVDGRSWGTPETHLSEPRALSRTLWLPPAAALLSKNVMRCGIPGVSNVISVT